MEKMYLVKTANGGWFHSFSPSGGVVACTHWSYAHFFNSGELCDVREILGRCPNSKCYEVLVTEPVESKDPGNLNQ